ncbi:MAG: hypothetical protein ABI743_03025 [bacterium]
MLKCDFEATTITPDQRAYVAHSNGALQVYQLEPDRWLIAQGIAEPPAAINAGHALMRFGTFTRGSRQIAWAGWMGLPVAPVGLVEIYALPDRWLVTTSKDRLSTPTLGWTSIAPVVPTDQQGWLSPTLGKGRQFGSW